VLSRIADSLYWLARYLERVDDTARLIEINLLHLLEAEEPASAETHWRPLLGISGNAAAYDALHADGLVTQDRVIHFLTRERTNPDAIRACLRLARDNARVVRDRISKEMWEIMNELWLRAAPHLDRDDAPDSMVQFCRTVRSEVARFHGVTVGTMMRGEAFGFYQLGTFVERADMTARILDVKYHLLLPALSLVGSALDYYQWAALLKSLSGFEAYRRRHQTGFSPATVAAFVVREPEFPHSLCFCLDRIAQALIAIDAGREASATARVVTALYTELVEPSPEDVSGSGLHDFLVRFVAGIGEVDATLRGELFHSAAEVPCAI
jgi:uncharacterized alpha-E superfamily protein